MQTITVPEELAAAVQSEAVRQLVSVRKVVEDFFATCWPAYQAVRVSEAFSRVREQRALDSSSQRRGPDHL